MATHRRILVTGAGRGLGKAIALELAHNGHDIGVLARTQTEVELVAGLIVERGGKAVALVADVLNPSQLQTAFRQFVEWAKGCDGLICAAGCLRGIGPIDQVDPDQWWRDVETSLRGAQLSIRELLGELRASGQGSIQLLIGPGFNGELANASGYATAQAGLVRLAESLAKELSPDVYVYAVNPGLVLTSLTEYLLESPEGRRWLPRFTEAFAEGKETEADAVAIMSAWLVAERPASLNGRVVAALATPTILETRLARIEAEGLGLLRLR